MSKALEKQLEKYEKIDRFKSAREQEIYSMRESAVKAMIEKEKLQEAVAVIWKSPRSKTAQEKLKSLNLYSKEVSIEESED